MHVRPTPEVARPRLIAVASGKGGVGKTWFAITLAQALAAHDGHVLLFDGDLGLANVDIQLGLNPAHDLSAVLAGRITLRDAATPCAAGGFDVLAGRSGSGALANLGTEQVDQILAGLAVLPYRHVLLDLSAGLDPATRRLAAGADVLLVIATDEPTSLTDAYAVIKLHAAAVPGADIRLVINQAASDLAGRRTYDTLARACTQFLGGAPALAGIVRRDDRVRDAIRRQMPLLCRHPASPAGADVARIADVLGRERVKEKRPGALPLDPVGA
jgi:flagellar biosynthesis protein FlhG